MKFQILFLNLFFKVIYSSQSLGAQTRLHRVQPAILPGHAETTAAESSAHTAGVEGGSKERSSGGLATADREMLDGGANGPAVVGVGVGEVLSTHSTTDTPSKTSSDGSSTDQRTLDLEDHLVFSTLLAAGNGSFPSPSPSPSPSISNTPLTKTAVIITSTLSIDRSKSRFIGSTSLTSLLTIAPSPSPSSSPFSNPLTADSGDFGTISKSTDDNPSPDENRSVDRASNNGDRPSSPPLSIKWATDKQLSGQSAADSSLSPSNSLVPSASALNNENSNPTSSSPLDNTNSNREDRGTGALASPNDRKLPSSPESSFGLSDSGDSSSTSSPSSSTNNNTATYIIIAGTGCLFLAGVAGLALYEKKSGRFSSDKPVGGEGGAALKFSSGDDGDERGGRDLSFSSFGASSYNTARNIPSFISSDDLEYVVFEEDGDVDDDDRLFHMPPLGPISAGYSAEDRHLIYKELHRTSMVESILEPGAAYVPGRLLYSANSVAACAASKSGTSQESQVSWSDAFMEDLTGFESDSARPSESILLSDDDSDISEDIKHLTHYADIKNLLIES